MRPLPVDAMFSYARRSERGIRVELLLEERAEIVADEVFVRFDAEQTDTTEARVKGEVQRAADGTRIVVDVRREKLSEGPWRLLLRDGEGGRLYDLRTSLFAAPRNPVALVATPDPRDVGH